MFPKRQRLAKALFPAVLARGRRVSSVNFSAVTYREAAGYAVVVSKKVSPRSPARHRIKRRVLAALRTLPLPSSFIIFPKASVEEMSSAEIRGELAVLLSKIRK